jgi:hypothetical protein
MNPSRCPWLIAGPKLASDRRRDFCKPRQLPRLYLVTGRPRLAIKFCTNSDRVGFRWTAAEREQPTARSLDFVADSPGSLAFFADFPDEDGVPCVYLYGSDPRRQWRRTTGATISKVLP